jgi:two-component system cell cycle sensor histidine kinase/response regulator CckA
MSLFPLQHPDGTPLLGGVSVEVTQQERAESEIRLLEAALRASSVAVFLITPEGTLRFANEAAAVLTGYDMPELLQLRLQDLDPGWPRENLHLHCEPPGSRRERRRVARIRRRDGSRVPVELSLNLVHSSDGVFECAWMMDVSERYETEQQLRYENGFRERVISHLPMGAFAKDPGNGFRYTVWNDRMVRITGLQASEVIGRTDYDLYPGVVARRMRGTDIQAMSGVEPIELEDEPWPTVAGDERLTRITKLAIPGVDDRPAMLFGLMEDITEKRRMEESLRQAQKLDAVGRIAGGVAHDFNNLLQVVLGYSEFALQHVDPSLPAAEDIAQVIAASNRAMGLVRQLLAFSKRQELEVTRLDPGALVVDMAGLLRRVLGAHIELCVEPGDRRLAVSADRTQLEQIVVNLCVNSRDAMPGGGRIDIGVRSLAWADLPPDRIPDTGEREFVGIFVRDNGPGIPRELQSRVFEPFFTTKGEGQGTGLGLATVEAIARRLGGCVDLVSAPDQGTAVTVYLPSAAGMDPRCDCRSGGPEGAVRTGSGQRLLVAEDDDTVRRLTREVLTRAGYRVVEARDGVEALQRFRDEAGLIDLLVLDVLMPGLNGAEVYREACRIQPRLPVLFCSGYSSDVLSSDYMVNLRTELLQKPFSRDQLLRKVDGLLCCGAPVSGPEQTRSG